MAGDDMSAIEVLLTTEGTYPVTRGGVSTWCDTLVRGMKGVRYQLYTILATPHMPARYAVPKAVRVQRVPMWGTEEPSEHLDIRFSQVYERKMRTTETVVRGQFLPLFDTLLQTVMADEPDGHQAGHLFYQMYQFFQQYDYLEAFKARPVWEFYLKSLKSQRWGPLLEVPTLVEAIQTIGWLYRFCIVLNTPVPKVDLVHSSAAAFCGVPGVLGKLQRRTPFLLTEHGVYLREQYLSIGRSGLAPFSKQFLLGLVRAVTKVNYAYADLVAPVAAFNARWERRLGVPESRIKVIYNGVDPEQFAVRQPQSGGGLTVVSVARIDPVKDIITLLRAAALVRRQMPEVKFVVYGGVSVPAYYKRCLEVKDELGLGEGFIFAGHVDDVPSAYASGSVVVLSSITEGFPYAVIEAMMSGRALVATDVGGSREACEGAGLLVPPQDPAAMATALLQLLRDPDLRLSLAEEGQQRALAYFTISRNLDLYRNVYADLAAWREETPAQPALVELLSRRRELAVHRAVALEAAGKKVI